jgi:hypothetical protein
MRCHKLFALGISRFLTFPGRSTTAMAQPQAFFAAPLTGHYRYICRIPGLASGGTTTCLQEQAQLSESL